jgi:hypothetical protein
MLYNVKMAQILQRGDQPFVGRGTLYIDNHKFWSTKRAPAYVTLDPQSRSMQVTFTIDGLTYNYGGPFHHNYNVDNLAEINLGNDIYDSDVILDDVSGVPNENSPLVSMLRKTYPNLKKDMLLERAGYMMRPIGRVILDQQSKIMLGHWLGEMRKTDGRFTSTPVLN